MANILVVPKVTIREPKKSKVGYYAVIEKNNLDVVKIRARDVQGKSRGEVGRILRDGTYHIDDNKINRLISNEIKQKIDFLLDMAYGKSRFSKCKLESGLIKYSK